ncbi:helix-turn-helix transcriptional regulator [Streptomyces rameus]
MSFSSYIHRREMEIHAQQLELAAVRAATAELTAAYAAHQGSRGSAGLERLNGVHEVRARLTELSRRATEELLAFMPGGALSQDALDASRPLDERSLESGVRLKTVFLDSVVNDRATTEYARWLSTLGGEVRTLPVLPLRMLVADRTTAVLPIDPEDSRQGAVIVHATGVVAALLALFDMAWERAVPLDGSRAPHADAPSRQELTLLNLLAQGHTDEVAARKLGLSLRTVRRMMASVSGKLGARSRFEAGVLASRSGWL